MGAAMTRRRGRPRQDQRDQLTVDVAAALRIVFQLGPQQARDFARALLEGADLILSRRGDFMMISFRLSSPVKGRSDGLKRRGPKPRDMVVRAIISALLHGKHIFAGCKGS
jgi:hypothetical protein